MFSLSLGQTNIFTDKYSLGASSVSSNDTQYQEKIDNLFAQKNTTEEQISQRETEFQATEAEYQSNVQSITQDIQTSQNSIATLSSTISNVASELQGVSQTVQSAASILNGLSPYSDEDSQKPNPDYVQALNQYTQAMAQQAQLQSELSSLNEELSSAEQEADELNNSLSEAQEEFSDEEAQKDSEISEWNNLIGTYQTQIDSLKQAADAALQASQNAQQQTQTPENLPDGYEFKNENGKVSYSLYDENLSPNEKIEKNLSQGETIYNADGSVVRKQADGTIISTKTLNKNGKQTIETTTTNPDGTVKTETQSYDKETDQINSTRDDFGLLQEINEENSEKNPALAGSTAVTRESLELSDEVNETIDSAIGDVVAEYGEGCLDGAQYSMDSNGNVVIQNGSIKLSVSTVDIGSYEYSNEDDEGLSADDEEYGTEEVFESEIVQRETATGETYNVIIDYEGESDTEDFDKISQTIDGEFRDQSQGSIGDCGLLAGINALNATQKGRALLRSAISKDENGFSVNMPGINRTTTITNNELTEALESDYYSRGDGDFKIMELAFEKAINEYGSEIASFGIDIKTVENNLEYGSAINGVDFQEFIGILAGEKVQTAYPKRREETMPDEYKENREFGFDSLLDKIEDPNVDCAAEICFTPITIKNEDGSEEIQDLIIKTTDGQEITATERQGAHAWSIESVNGDDVVIVNPWNNSVKYTVSRDTLELASNIKYFVM